MANPFSEYKKQSIRTMTPGEIVVRLFGELEKCIAIAASAIGKKDYQQANESFMKAQSCISALRNSLDMKIEISSNLDKLYEYFSHEILQANIKKDADRAKAVLSMVAELKEAFYTISQQPKEGEQKAATV